MTFEVSKKVVGQCHEAVHKSGSVKPQEEVWGYRSFNAEQKVLPQNSLDLHKPFNFVCAGFWRSARRWLIYGHVDTPEDESIVQREENESLRIVGKEILADEGLHQGLAQTQCQKKKNIRQTKGKKPQKGRMSVRIGRWKVKRGDTAIE